MSAPVPGTALPWAWASEDHSALILGGADDYITHCVMWVSPCEACQDRSETKQWKWGACTTPSEQDAAYIAHACNNFPELLEALDWAMNELNGKTRYDNDAQQERCFEIAATTLANAIGEA